MQEVISEATGSMVVDIEVVQLIFSWWGETNLVLIMH